jgi:alcohol dehydrogenase
MPRSVAAATAMDALSHALESFVTRRRNPVSQLFAREAWRLLEGSFENFLADPEDARARGRMLLGAHLGGAAIETSMLGAAHSCANPLTAHFGITHGIAVGLMLPHVIRYNGSNVDPLYEDLAHVAHLEGPGSAPERVGRRVAELQALAGLPLRLADCGVVADTLPQLAEEAAAQWTARFNPREVARDDLEQLYRDAF